ncbi:hypothetical protein TL16_g05104 [Triparma laevis f. inornata]|uniref:Elongator complex protein 2 n=1 Tax=Triparma laevis f. inornata TaxID=1714386 RepID=A0A9W7AK41_9STRA|nr:hypothetical protein TL16_g05104 [Triparma laevis f. inornata]
MAASASTSLLSIAACNSQPQSLLTLPSSNLVYAGHGSLFHVPLNRGNPSPFSIPAPSNSPKISCLCSIKAADNTATNSFFAAHADGAINLFLSLSSPPQPYTPADHTVTCAASLQTMHSTILACGTTDPDGSGVSIYTADPSSPPLTLNPPNTSLIVEALDIFVQSSTIVLVAGCALARSNRIFVFAAPLDPPTPSFTAVGSLSGHQDWVRCFSSTTALANGNVLLASGSHDHKIRLWNFQSSKEKVDSVEAVDEDEVDVDALLEDQARLCFTVGDDNIKVTLEALLIGHEESVTSLSFNPSPSLSTQPTLLSSSMDRTLLVWQMTDSGVWMPVARVGSAGGIVGGR